ncbi:hypothetical protein ASE14_06610 [Agromyces sp. Root81]|nr:hypothetical protein ASE14_06610 [Agromyces sp. Root81]
MGEVPDESERDRLAARAYSREAESEPVESFVDPDSGETVRTRRSAWELREYDRRIASAARLSTVPHDEPADEDETRTAAAAPRIVSAAPRTRVVLLSALGGAAIAAVVFSAATIGRELQPSPSPSAPPPATMMLAMFAGSRFPQVDPGDAVTAGFEPGSFRLLVDGGGADDAVALYAAKRGGDEYCFVAVNAHGRRVADCSTPEHVGEHGLEMTVDAVRDGQLGAVTVRWGRDGIIRVDP